MRLRNKIAKSLGGITALLLVFGACPDAAGLIAPARANTPGVDFSDPEALPAGLYPALVGAIQSEAPTAYRVTLGEASRAGR